MTREEFEKILAEKECETVEFKTSLAEEEEAIQSMIAFTNTGGGRVFFGVKNDGEVVGVDIGNNTLENLANNIKRYTYPSLVSYTEDFDYDGKKVLIAEVPRDVPPLMGVYLYCSRELYPQPEVNTSNMQAYRRVGRTNQKVDFMNLRAPQPFDPNVILSLDGAGCTMGMFFPKQFSAYVRNAGPGTAFNISFRVKHTIYKLEGGFRGIDLPVNEPPRRIEFATTTDSPDPDKDPGQQIPPAHLVATYGDEKGFKWESVRELVPQSSDSGKTDFC
ncbi:MAG: ATP-binding protein [Chloroflexi bacterium]|nr:ATP-binding protein [Chloroflexota bacterium]